MTARGSRSLKPPGAQGLMSKDAVSRAREGSMGNSVLSSATAGMGLQGVVRAGKPCHMRTFEGTAAVP